ncbi:ras guanine nucleotide exchange factor domain-containing protein [Mycena floridula]|nr:ras guanine nucleotide exchange factor domain-containing protein [Mycena floridula]
MSTDTSTVSSTTQTTPTGPMTISGLLRPIVTDNHEPLSKSPASSFASHDSFSTAVTSPDNRDSGSPVSPSMNRESLLPPTQSLRKSISVDSFVQYGREAHSTLATRPNRGHTTVEPPRGLVLDLSGLNRDRSDFGRNRGASIGSVVDGYQSSLVSEYDDIENQDPLRVNTRRSSVKDHTRPFVRAGDLALPSRTPTLSTTSSMSSIMSASTSSSTQDGFTPLSASASLQSIPRRNIGIVSTGRARSGSLGIPPTRRIHATSMSKDNSSFQNLSITLVVVGVAGCGKSAVVKKGLKGFGLSDPPVPLPGAAAPRYTRRVGRITENENSISYVLSVIEIDLSPTELDAASLVPETSRVDGVIVCYDSSSAPSFQPVEGLLRRYCAMRLPTVVLACKSDLERQVDPQAALEVIQQFDAGLVEVSGATLQGREKMRRSFQWLLKAIRFDRHASRVSDDYRNPASPDMILSPPWEGSGTVTPTSGISGPNLTTSHVLPSSPAIPSSRSPTAPNSPTRARSTGDLLSEHQSAKLVVAPPENGLPNMMVLQNPPPATPIRPGPTLVDVVNGAREVNEEKKEEKKESRPAQWAGLDDLLDKLMFLAVSGDDATYITHFLLTYRRFANPRSILLAMQKRMRQLDNPSGDPMFACFAQMRICHLLELWIRDYPHDFAVRGTAGALSALIKSIISKTYLLHYGSDFLPFLELLPNLVDKDAAWALKVDDSADESDDSYSLLEDDDDSLHKSEVEPVRHTPRKKALPVPVSSRERKPSLPLTAKTFLPSANGNGDHVEINARQQIRELQRVASDLNLLDSEDIAQEITRIEVKLFLQIEPRHWLQYTLASGKKDPAHDSIARFNEISNHLAAWVVSLILCHDRAKARARQIEKFVEIAQKLRALNNYSALRAVVAGINNSTFPGDQTMEHFKAKSPEHAKNLQSWDVLLQAIRSHRAYRLALRNTKGACIPALEVHMSDLIRTHEGNPDVNASDPNKVHWGKFNLMGRFVSSTTQCQAQCRASNDYNFLARPHIEELINTSCLMNEEMQTSRIAPQEDEEYSRPRNPTQSSIQPRDAAKLRRLFFW